MRVLGKISLFLVAMIFSVFAYSYNPGLKTTVGKVEPDRGCVYREAAGDWVINDCEGVGAHNACYNGSVWKIALANGTVAEENVPQPSLDDWDPIRADGICKDRFGPSYFFSVPTSAEEDVELGFVMNTEIPVQFRNTWLYYYSNEEDVPKSANFWFGNRSAYSSFFTGSNNDQATGAVADCTVMNSSGNWEDMDCKAKYPFACFVDGDWVVTDSIGEWRAGYSKCDTDGVQALYAVPRTQAENDDLVIALGNKQLEVAVPSDYEKLWLNRSDLVFEEFFISNQSRRAWWGESQPTNRGNADCALIDSAGNWTAASCTRFQAFHACYVGKDGDGVAQWALTKDLVSPPGKSLWANGFGYCKRLSPAGEFSAPGSARANLSSSSNTALANLLDEGEYAWINFSDQDNEGAWISKSYYQDFAQFDDDDIDSRDNLDCGVYSTQTNSEGNWLTAKCFSADGDGVDRGFACTNGYEWKVTSYNSKLWKDGFQACLDFGPDYSFAAPSSADQNSRLGIVLNISGLSEAWLNLNDAEIEGEWVANGPEVNLGPVLSLPSELVFNEGDQIDLVVSASDPEGQGISNYTWIIQNPTLGGEERDVLPTLISSSSNSPDGASSTFTVDAVKLVNDPLYFDVLLQVTDDAPSEKSTTSTVLSIKVLPALQAAYDFNSYTNPALDLTGNGFDLDLNLSQLEIKNHIESSADFYVSLDALENFSIDGGSGGLQVGVENGEYTVFFRYKLDKEPNADWAGVMQRGASNDRQPAIFYNMPSQLLQYTNSTETEFNNAMFSIEKTRAGQWMTIAYVKKGKEVLFYVDKAERKDNDPIASVPDSTLDLPSDEDSVGYDSGNWVFGNVAGASEGIAGGFDDIRIYNRALTSEELQGVFPSQPVGRFEFVESVQEGSENETVGSSNEVIIKVARVQGDDVPEPLTEVAVGYKLISGSAELHTDFDLKAGDDVNVAAGTGTLYWAVHDRGYKDIVVELKGDSLREGVESFSIELEKLPTEPELANRTNTQVNIEDKTPNPYGAIAFASSDIANGINVPVDEGSTGKITLERTGSDSQGSYEVTFDVYSIIARMPADFTILETLPGVTFNANLSGGDPTFIGTGIVQFPDSSPDTKQVREINFSTVDDGVIGNDEEFNLAITGIRNLGGAPIADEDAAAILGTNKVYTQRINDVTPGAISFAQANVGIISETLLPSEGYIDVNLERSEGVDGALCVEIIVDASSTASVDDIEIEYGVASTGAPTGYQNQVAYWPDQDGNAKTVRVKAVFDNVYEVNSLGEAKENLILSFVNKDGCYDVAATTGVNANASIEITDVTEAANLEFSAGEYKVSERSAEGSVRVTVKNTGNTANAFQVYLDTGIPDTDSAIKGVHYQQLPEASAVLQFNEGATEAFIDIGIPDNCDPTDELFFNSVLDLSASVLSNNLPDELIVFTGNAATVVIEDAYPAVAAVLSIVEDGVSNPASSTNGRYRVTDSNFDPTSMRFQAVNNTDDNCFSNYEWSTASVSPAVPSGGSLPGDFTSQFPSTFGSQLLSNIVSLPFITENTTVNYQLIIDHPEDDVDRVFPGSIALGAYWRRLTVGGECAEVKSNNRVNDSGSCSSSTGRNFVLNRATNQIVGQAKYGGEVGCWQEGGNVDYRACSSSASQEFRFELNSPGVCGDTLELRTNNNAWVVEEFFGSEIIVDSTPSSSSCAERRWSWTGSPPS